MQIQKLSWAGIKVVCGNKTVLIDAVENFKPYLPVLGKPRSDVFIFSPTTTADYILFTHLHLDHFDMEVIDKCLKPEGKIIANKKLQHQIPVHNHECIFLDVDQSITENGITFKSVFSLDGIGEEQTAWILDFNGTKIFHGGDTIWHNQFWKIGKENPDIDYAFLPVNGAVVNFQIVGLEYSSIPASLTPSRPSMQPNFCMQKNHTNSLWNVRITLYQPIELDQTVFEELSRNIHQPMQILNDADYLTPN
ncbi:MAG: MBL fold metallo-hydrolase [Chitinophagaceae bacterium]|nr:MBL fold metallo-hydrolase [Chitinophagaceae bacterium]